MKNLFKAIPFFYCIAISSTAFAVDGVLEINHTCATQLGCFSGDSLGYPVQINGVAGKSYRLTSDLVIPDENTHGIFISANDISIDLNGFSILGVSCVGVIVDCTPNSGSGDGITMGLTAILGTSIKNGSIIGMGRRGGSIIGSNARIENMIIRWNPSVGLLIRANTMVKNCTISNNGGDGIDSGSGANSIIIGNRVFSNNSNGINVGIASLIKNNTVHNNASVGISGNSGSTIIKNTSYANGSDGISSSRGSSIIGNTSYQNGDDGIFVGTFDGGFVKDNIVHSNTGYGIRFFSGNNPYSQNTIINNTAGTVNQGFDMGDNFCETNKVCP